ncbi:hypothetical protein RF11_11668 [Thelohanellus kitauei]|uniref:Uncharacterized protein n=1 Tax=Thelohanellus kitauei TaxID=669202 RepID=A0A0C2M5I7_THEKT|nr:hypothetical protein RF11_11668 [Thelohanellus kitauei]
MMLKLVVVSLTLTQTYVGSLKCELETCKILFDKIYDEFEEIVNYFRLREYTLGRKFEGYPYPPNSISDFVTLLKETIWRSISFMPELNSAAVGGNPINFARISCGSSVYWEAMQVEKISYAIIVRTRHLNIQPDLLQQTDPTLDQIVSNTMQAIGMANEECSINRLSKAEMSTTRPAKMKKLKVDRERLIFNKDWMFKYFYTEFDNKTVYLLLNECVSVLKNYLICHYVTKHAEYVNALLVAQRQYRATDLDRKLKEATLVSFVVAYISNHSKSFFNGEFFHSHMLDVNDQARLEHRKIFEEDTDDSAQLLIFLKGILQKLEITEKSLFIESMNDTTTGENIFEWMQNILYIN